MAGGEVTPTLIQHFNEPNNVDTGATARKTAMIYVEATSTATGTTLDLSTWVSGLSGITNISESVSAATNLMADTANTWSGTTITFAGHTATGVWNLRVRGYY